MRVATFNVFGGRTPGRRGVDVGRFRDAIAGLDADVLAMQEVDRGQARSGLVDLTAVAAEALGAEHHRFVPALWGTPGERWRPAHDNDGEERTDVPAYGVALVSRYPVTAWRTVRLAGSRVAVPLPVPGRRTPVLVRDEPRVAVVATIQAPGGTVTVVGTHLSFVPWRSGGQLGELVAALADAPRPLVLLGDLNLGGARAERLTGMRSASPDPTHPAHAPRRQLDHVLLDGPADGPLRVRAARAVQTGVSDHRAVVVDLG